VRCVVDTGAPLSYVPGTVAKHHDVIGERKDFFPGVGSCTTSVYRIPMEIDQSPLPLECGVLPAGVTREGEQTMRCTMRRSIAPPP